MPERPVADGVTDDAIEHFRPTSGRFTGILALAMCASALVASILQHDRMPADIPVGAVFAAVLAWTALLRPRVSASTNTLVLRNMLQTVELPLAAVDELFVRQVLVVRAAGRQFVSPAVGRSARKVRNQPTMRQFGEAMTSPGSERGSVEPVNRTSVDYADFVEVRLRNRIEQARRDLGMVARSPESAALMADVRRRPAWLEIAALTVATFALVIVVLTG